MREKKILGSIGEKCTFMDRKVPLYPNLIRLGNNVHLASNVTFVTHDITHKMINNCMLSGGIVLPDENSNAEIAVREKLGGIELGDNVFIGTGATILYDVKIGSNVIVAAGSVVTKDIPDNCIAAGVPARAISTLDAYIMKRLQEETYDPNICPRKQEVGPELEKWCWDIFNKKRMSVKMEKEHAGVSTER